MDLSPTIDAMRTCAGVLKVGDVRDSLRALQAVQDAADAAKAVLLDELTTSRDFELDGCSSVSMWARTELRLNAGQATQLVKNCTALRELTQVAEAALTGQISAAHVRVFVYGIKMVGVDLMRQHEDEFLSVALQHAPGDLFEAVKYLKDVTHPDDLDDSWEAGMDKQDFCIDAVPDGFHVTGFLSTTTGAKLKAVIDSLAAPRDAEDTRTGSQRRIQAVDDLASAFLASGLPSDKGIKPHLSVFVDAETLHDAAEEVRKTQQNPFHRPTPPKPGDPLLDPAELAGHGRIGPHLLMYLRCIGTTTGFVMKQDQVLNVGRDKYEPNLKQRKAVIARQHGVCATPGCHHTYLEVHHKDWWSLGGTTDIDLLIGLCTRCHHLVHRGLLHITGNATDGFEFTNRHHSPLRTRNRRRQPPRPDAA